MDLAAALSWAACGWDREVVAHRRLEGGITSTMLLLEDGVGERAVLRLMSEEPWARHGPELVAREGWAQHELARGGVPAPRSIAVQPDRDLLGCAAHLMTWLPGRPELVRHDDDALRAMAGTLSAVHAHQPRTQPRTFQSWSPPAKRIVPPWALEPRAWRRAFAVLARPQPDWAGRFLHRDANPGNLLWVDGVITGVVDWVETSWGPPELDVAHVRTNLALLHGPEVARRYLSLEGGGSLTQWWWDVLDVVGFLPDPGRVAPPWRAAGRDVPDPLVRARLEAHLLAVLEGH